MESGTKEVNLPFCAAVDLSDVRLSGQTERQTDRQTDGQTDRWKDRLMGRRIDG